MPNDFYLAGPEVIGGKWLNQSSSEKKLYNNLFDISVA